MQTAIIFNKATQKGERVTAAEYRDRFITNIDAPEEIELLSPERGVPVIYRKGHTRQGNEVKVRDCFACAAGYGLKDHIFDHNQDSVKEALAKGKKVLLSLNENLSYRALNFREMRAADGQSLENWIGANHGNYISISVRSAKEAIQKIQFIHEQGLSVNKNIFALYRGGVMPYQDFYLGNQSLRLRQLYDDLFQNQQGVPLGESRIIGFPRLFRFLPTESTLTEQGARGLKGNLVSPQDGEEGKVFSRLIFTDKEIASTPSYQSLWQQISNNHPDARYDGSYILACPSITVNPDTKDDPQPWKMLRWIITDVATQSCAPGTAQPQTKAQTKPRVS